MSNFEELWKFATRNGIGVQEKSELEHIFNLMKSCDCHSYLEVGSAEGNSLYVLGNAFKGTVDYIDFGEAHTSKAREEAIGKLGNVGEFLGDSTNPKTHPRDRNYDCVLIDAAHDYSAVLSDSILYAPLATKYVFWHDVQLPEVKAAVYWFMKRWKLGRYYEFINSDSYGYGICEIGNDR